VKVRLLWIGNNDLRYPITLLLRQTALVADSLGVAPSNCPSTQDVDSAKLDVALLNHTLGFAIYLQVPSSSDLVDDCEVVSLDLFASAVPARRINFPEAAHVLDDSASIYPRSPLLFYNDQRTP
jgi:hypothetical protein